MPEVIAAERSALAAVGGSVDSPSKRKKPKARQMPKKRGAYPPSVARLLGGILCVSRNTENAARKQAKECADCDTRKWLCDRSFLRFEY